MDFGTPINYSEKLNHEALDAGLFVSFFHKPVEYEEEGELLYKQVEYCKIIVTPGRNEVVKPVNDEIRERFRSRYDAWKAGEDVPVEGTPLTEWPLLNPAEVATAKAHKIFTVEQLAALADGRVEKLHLLQKKYKAQDWLDSRRDAGVVSKLRDDINEKTKVIDTLEDKITQLQVQIDNLIADRKPSGGRRRSTKTADGN